MDREYVSRRAGRFVPASSVTIALLEKNQPIAYGVVRDISELGACIMTDALLSPGKSYELRMSFFGSDILEAVARIVWQEPGGPARGDRAEGGVPHGVEFTEIPPVQLQALKRILGQGGFASTHGH